VALWFGLAAYSCGGSCGLRARWSCAPHRIPCSLSWRETVDPRH